MKYLPWFLLLALVAGCAGKIRPDPVAVSAMDAGYPSAEVRACGKEPDELGLVPCSIKEGQLLDSLKIQVVGYYKGTIKFSSDECGVNQEVSYEGTALVPLSIPGEASRNCLVTVTVSPNFPRESSSGIKVHSLRGHVYIHVLKANENFWNGHARKVTGNFSSHLSLWVGNQTEVRVVLAGCGMAQPWDKRLPVVDGSVDVELSEIIPQEPAVKTCILEGVIISQVYKDVLMSVMVSKFDDRFTPLPIPVVKVDGDKLIVEADAGVSAIALNQEYKLNRKAKFKFDPKAVNYLRMVTVAGRAVLGIWNPQSQDWSWKN